MNKKTVNIAFIEPKVLSRYNYTPLGLAYMSGYLKKYGAAIYNSKLFRINNDIHDVIAFNPDIIAITSMTHTFYLANDIANLLRKALPKATIVLGGQHLSAAPYSFTSDFDYGITGEGELAFLNLINAISNTPDTIEKQPSLLFHRDGELFENPRLPLIEPMDSIPFPDRTIDEHLEDIIKSSNFGRFNRTGVRWMQLNTARGCPYKCKFCQPAATWKKFRMHSAEYIAEEIQYIRDKYAIDAIQVEDDLFTGNKKRLLSLIDILAKKDLLGKMIFNVAARAEQIDEEWVEILKELGVVKIEFGIEAGSDRIARYWKGGKATKEINLNAVNILNKAGISVFGSFIAGAPDETWAELKETHNMMLKINKMHPHNQCSIGLATPLPGTELWDYGVNANMIHPDKMDWELLTTLSAIPKDTSKYIYLNQHIPAERTVALIKKINKKMYLGTPLDFVKAIPRRTKKLIKMINS